MQPQQFPRACVLAIQALPCSNASSHCMNEFAKPHIALLHRKWDMPRFEIAPTLYCLWAHESNLAARIYVIFEKWLTYCIQTTFGIAFDHNLFFRLGSDCCICHNFNNFKCSWTAFNVWGKGNREIMVGYWSFLAEGMRNKNHRIAFTQYPPTAMKSNQRICLCLSLHINDNTRMPGAFMLLCIRNHILPLLTQLQIRTLPVTTCEPFVSAHCLWP